MKVKLNHRILSSFLVMTLVIFMMSPFLGGVKVSAATQQLCTGLTYETKSITNHAGKTVPIFMATMDISRSNLKIGVGIPNDTPPLHANTVQTVKNQAIAAQNHGKDVMIAINGDFFNESTQLLPAGVTIREGVKLNNYSTQTDWRQFFFGIKKDGTPVIGDRGIYSEIEDELVEAIGGGPWLIRNGMEYWQSTYDGLYPRTVVGIKPDGSVIFLVADGKSEIRGLSYGDVRDYMLSLGVVDALNLDGGGSCTMIVKNTSTGSLELKNEPYEGQRKVANSLMVINTGLPALQKDSDGYYLIEKYSDLAQIPNDLSGKFRLTCDISAKNQTAVSISSFEGEFDGNGFAIKDSTAALFTSVSSGAYIHDLILKDVNISTSSGTAALAIDCAGAVERVCVNGSIKGGNYSAGLVSKLKTGGSLTLCKAEMTIEGSEVAGGIVADATGKTVIDRCYSNSTISGIMRIGGIVGSAADDSSTASITNCIASGSISVTKYQAGGIGGLIKIGVTNCIVRDMTLISQGNTSSEPSGGNVSGLLGGWCNGTMPYENNVIISGSITTGGICAAHRICYNDEYKINNYAYENITINGSYVDSNDTAREGINTTIDQLQDVNFYTQLGYDFNSIFYWDSQLNAPMLKCIDSSSHTNIVCNDDSGHWFKCTSCLVTQKIEKHTYGSYVYNNNAGCVTNGTESATCNVCGYITSREVPNTATGHTYNDAWSYNDQYHYNECISCGRKANPAVHTIGKYVYNNDGTCSHNGTETAKCSVCEYGITRAKAGTINPNQHTFGEYVYNNDATCGQDGTKTATCTGCGITNTVTAEGTATGQHSFGSYVYNNDATCVQDGTKTATCVVCGFKQTVTATGTATGQHSFGNYVYNNDATCTQDGTKTATCAVCGITRTITATGTATGHHSFGSYVYNNDATCGQDGTETAKCIYCDATNTRTKTGTATGQHSFGNYVYNNDATCIHDGTKTATCAVCGFKQTVTAEGTATGQHSFGNYVYNNDATCTQDGTKTATCAVCGITRTITATGTATGQHSFGNYVYNNDATCGQDGTETAKCIYCDATNTRTKTGTATGQHSFGSYVYNNDATCTQDGTKTATCAVCGFKRTVTAEGTSIGQHIFGNYVYNNDATCGQDGTETAKCIYCDATDTRTKTGTATGQHIFGSYVYNNDATCVQDGTKTATCVVCKLTQTVPAVGTATGNHLFSSYVYNNDATCTQDGTKTATCAVCGVTQTIIATGTAFGHNYGSEWLYDENTHYHKCNLCGNIAHIANHILSSYIYNNDATVDADGTETASCALCGYTHTRTAEGTKIQNPDKPNLVDSSKMFTDVVASAWYKEAIDYAVTYGILKGYADNTVKPNKAITRAEFVQILANIEGVDTSNKNITTSFGDVLSGQWYAPAIQWAYNNKLVNGVGDGNFSPNSNLNREQMCKIFYDYLNYKGLTIVSINEKASFTDDSSISSWAKDYVYACQMAGFIDGIDGAFKPKNIATRAQVATIIMRLDKTYNIVQGTL